MLYQATLCHFLDLLQVQPQTLNPLLPRVPYLSPLFHLDIYLLLPRLVCPFEDEVLGRSKHQLALQPISGMLILDPPFGERIILIVPEFLDWRDLSQVIPLEIFWLHCRDLVSQVVLPLGVVGVRQERLRVLLP